MVLLSAEQGLKVPQIAVITRESPATVLRWLKRYRAELLAAARRRPRSLGLPFSLWTLQRLVDYLAESTGIRVSDETVRRTLKQVGIVLSRPQHLISSPDPEYQVKKRRSKRPATTCNPGMHSTTPTNSTSVGCPRCGRCGARGDDRS